MLKKVGGLIDITDKKYVFREACAEGKIFLKKDTINRIREGDVEKGDVLESTKVAVLNAVKNTPDILPYCHPIKLTDIKVEFELFDEYIKLRVIVKAIEQTGVEMEALTGVVNGLLCIWDMIKKYEKDERGEYPYTRITDVKVVYKKKVD